MITRERWQRIKDLFHLALLRPAAERPEFLAHACEDDLSMRDEVASLISAHEEDEGFLDAPAYQFAAEMLADEVPHLQAGQRLGPFTILSALGAGGMGEVYLAQDQRLGRNVAVKLLAPKFARDEQRVLRFEQEARAASALNHPNVCVIHEIGRAEDGRHYMAMEFIEGVTLRRRLAEGALTLKEALDVAAQVAWALEAAHAAGIVHRDIKPENIMLRSDGYVKVLDFGIAKFNAPPSPSLHQHEVSTVAQFHTAPGTQIGTVKYMSPEQLREQSIDARTDIWSLGVVLHEMVTGVTPFESETTNDTIAVILERQPARLDFFSSEIPEEFRQVIRKALSKRRGDRYRSIKDLALDLRKLRREISAGGVSEKEALNRDMPVIDKKPAVNTGGTTILSRVKSQAFRTADYVLSEIKQHKTAAIFAGVSVAVFALLFIPPGSPPAFKMTTFTNSGKSVCAAVSPDGKAIAHVENVNGKQSLLITRIVTGGTSVAAPAEEFVYRGLTFSQDNNYLYFTRSEKNEPGILYQITVPAGNPRKIKEGVDSPISFSPAGDKFSFVRWNRGSGEYALMIAGTDGSDERTIATRSEGNTFSLSGTAWSDEKTVACGTGWWDHGYHMNLVEFDVITGQKRPISDKQWFSIYQVAWLPDKSALVFSARERWTSPYQLWRISYPDGQTSELTHDTSEYESASLSYDGNTIVSVRSQQVAKIWVAPDGDAQRAKEVVSTIGYRYGLTWTGSGKLVYSSMVGSNVNISVVNADGSNPAQLTANAGDNYTPAISADDRFVVFASNRGGGLNIWRMNAADGSEPKQLTFSDGNSYPSCSPDGKWVVYDNQSKARTTIWKVSIDGGEPIQLSDEYTRMPVVSPDGQFIACRYYDAPNGLRGIAVLPSQGGAPLQRLPIPVMDWQRVQWTANSEALTYVDNSSGTPNIWSYNLASHERKQLTFFNADQIFAYSWTPDFKQLASQHGSELRDVILMTKQK